MTRYVTLANWCRNLKGKIMYMFCYRNPLSLVFINVHRNWVPHTLLYPLASTKMMMKPTSVSTSVVTIRPLWNYNAKRIHISNMKIVISCGWVIIHIRIIKFLWADSYLEPHFESENSSVWPNRFVEPSKYQANSGTENPSQDHQATWKTKGYYLSNDVLMILFQEFTIYY